MYLWPGVELRGIRFKSGSKAFRSIDRVFRGTSDWFCLFLLIDFKIAYWYVFEHISICNESSVFIIMIKEEIYIWITRIINKSRKSLVRLINIKLEMKIYHK